MTIKLGDDIIPNEEDLYRIRYAAVWQGEATAWINLPMQEDSGTGFEVVRYSRRALPDEGEAVIGFNYGSIDGRTYLINYLPNLDYAEIRIEQWRPDDELWETVWKGQCVARNDLCLPGSDTPVGFLEYHCKDDLHRTAEWPVWKHQFWDGSQGNLGPDLLGCEGNPGYNRQAGPNLVGNHKITNPTDPLGAGFDAHTWFGSSDAGLWSDLDALKHAIASATPRQGTMSSSGPSYLAPKFTVAGALDALSGSQFWRVTSETRLRDLIVLICDRRRGRGLAYADWDQDGDILTPVLRIRPQFLTSMAKTLPSGNIFNVAGATPITVDLQGDCTLGDNAPQDFRLTQETATLYERLEAYGDPIRVLITACELDYTFTPRYTTNEITNYRAFNGNAHEADATQFHHVFRTYGLPLNWNMMIGQGLGTPSSLLRCDYRTNDLGQIVIPTGSPDSPLMVRISDDLPLASGYNYTFEPPTRWDSNAETSTPEPLPIQVWLRTDNTLDIWMDASTAGEIHITRGGNDGATDLTFQGNEQGGVRFWEANNSALVAVTMAVDMPNRLMVALQTNEQPRKVKKIEIPGLALHLAHPYAIWSLDANSPRGAGFLPRRHAGNGSSAGNIPGILRDDRDRLAKILLLAAQWYLVPRNPVTYARLCGGFEGQWTDSDGNRHDFEGMGDFIGTLRYGGREIACNSPITGMDYDRATGKTTWIANWSDFDWRGN